MLKTAEEWQHRAGAILRGEEERLRDEGLYWRWKQAYGKETASMVPVPGKLEGKLQLVRDGLFTKIAGRYVSEFSFPAFWRRSPEPVIGRADAVITDPAEWMRNVDLARVYGAELKRRWISRPQAESAMQRFFDLQAPESFPSHGQAAAYLRQLVQGKESSRTTPHGVRVMDAMTADGTLHQAYLTFTLKGLREQMAKDVYLIREGDPVQAVVWHFFRRTGQKGKVGPSEAFIRELEENGISVVIHD